jgi:hypothetical protein
LRLWAALENRLLSGDESWWSGRNPLFGRVVADVPLALYLNFIGRKSYAASQAPGFFQPFEIAGAEDAALFTILFFSLEHTRPVSAPRWLGAIAPPFVQSNWRFYGRFSESADDTRAGVLFVRTITTSLMLAFFGRRLARCFPLLRARHMTIQATPQRVTAAIEPGGGSAPALAFSGDRIDAPQVPPLFAESFSSYEAYARSIIDQHLSVAIWPRERIVQDMHLNFREARIIPLRSVHCNISGMEQFAHAPIAPIDCFAVSGLQVYLDDVSVSDSMAEQDASSAEAQ